MRRIKKMALVMAAIMLLSCVLSTNVSAATKSQDLTRSTDYYDALIPSLKLGRVTGYLTFSYNNCTYKLVNQKSAYVSGTVALASVTNKIAKWDYYNTTSRKGEGQASLGWDVLFGVDTSWFKIGITTNSEYSKTKVYGNGTWAFK